jgi:hypothetical protein
MSTSGVLCNKAREAIAKGWVGTIVGASVRNEISYFVFGEGGFQTSSLPLETIATGNGSQTAFTHSLSHDKLMRGTLIVTAGSVVATDNGQGIMAGTGVAGSISYSFGQVTLNYIVPPGIGVPITASYDYKGVPLAPDASLLRTVAQSSPSSPTNLGHLAYYRKSFELTGTEALKQAVSSPRWNFYGHLYLRQDEFLDNGRGDPPVLYEVGVFDSEDTMLCYSTFDGFVKDGSVLVDKKVRLYA